MFFRRVLLTTLLLLASALSTNVLAATAVCTGKVERLAYHQPDGLFIKLSSTNIIKMCDLKAQFYRTSPESCQLIASLATMARATDKSLQIYVDNAPEANCLSMVSWFSADMRFVELLP
jgi:hypothetical protein